MALGSLAELEAQPIISKKLGHLKDDESTESIEKQRRKQLNLIKYRKGVQK